MTAHFWRRKDAVIDWYRGAREGARLLYFVGDLLAARSVKDSPQAEAIAETADLIMGMYQEGQLDARQARLDEGIRAYFCYKVSGDGVRLNEVSQKARA